MYDLRQPAPVDLEGDSLFAEAVRNGKSLVFEKVTDDVLQRYAANPDQLEQLRQTGLQALLVVPVVGREKTLGAFTFLQIRPGRQFPASRNRPGRRFSSPGRDGDR